MKKLLIAPLLASSLGGITLPASADIVQCVDSQGRITLTDTPCVAGVQSTVATGLNNYAAPAARVASRARPLARMLACDVETLKAARVSMQALDAASAAPRQ